MHDAHRKWTDTSALPGLPPRYPILSEMDEARAMQYHCECIEVALLRQQGECQAMHGGMGYSHGIVPGLYH
jgi:hypothetical protein